MLQKTNWLKVARQNGIKDSTYYYRSRVWKSKERAATTPLRVKVGETEGDTNGVVTSLTEYTRDGRDRAMVKCNCGHESCRGEFEVLLSNFRRKEVLSCGADRLERMRSAPNRGNTKPKGEAAFNSLYSSYKQGAHRRNLQFNLTKEQVKEITKEPCFYCGKEPSNIYHNPELNGDYIYTGIDRIHRTANYEYTSVVPCCKECNNQKGTKDWDEYIEWKTQKKEEQC